ncbi:WhiB family transcriptional regulator [Streptomyces sp. TRM75563]|uniref:WhiB family transcriptional regulator n=1 Tax=Streptomyces sp. TRM75563 TaxID=2817418 RepID=UPI002415B87B|nr:WhiB family transcriptional regulator [Streptomyces sp. TRM75563]
MSPTLFKVVKSHTAPAVADRAADWRDAALCRSPQYDPEMWFPKGTDAVSMANEREAKRTCAGCPALAACREWAIETRQDHGVWGGLSERERHNLRRRAQSRAVARVPMQTFGSVKDAYQALTQKDGRHVIWTGGNEVRIGKDRTTPNQVAWRATRRDAPVGRVFTDCDHDGCVKHLNDQAMRQAREATRRAAA